MYLQSKLSHNWLFKQLINEKVVARLSALSGVVLDLGCGERPFESDILKFAESYIGLDWSNTLHDLRADVVANLNKPLPVADAAVNNIVSFEVLEHLAEPSTMLGEAWRVLVPGGGLTLSTPFQWWLHEAPWDYQRFTRYGLEYQLRKCGFIDIKIYPISGFWSMWFLKLNYQLARLVRGPRLVRVCIRALFVPFWWLNQVVAQLLDGIWSGEQETVGYFAIARKPVA